MLQTIFEIKSKLDFAKLNQFSFQLDDSGNLSQLRFTFEQELEFEDVKKISDLLKSSIDGPTNINYTIGGRSQVVLQSAR